MWKNDLVVSGNGLRQVEKNICKGNMCASYGSYHKGFG